MDYGIVLPHFGSFARREAASRILAAAETAESLGFSTVWVIDHVVLPAGRCWDAQVFRVGTSVLSLK